MVTARDGKTATPTGTNLVAMGLSNNLVSEFDPLGGNGNVNAPTVSAGVGLQQAFMVDNFIQTQNVLGLATQGAQVPLTARGATDKNMSPKKHNFYGSFNKN